MKRFKRLSEVAGIKEPEEKENNFLPGTPRKLSLIEVFDDYDLSHDMLKRSDVDDDESLDMSDHDEDDSDHRHMHRLAKSMGISMSEKEKEMEPMMLIQRRVLDLGDYIDFSQSDGDRMINDPWNDFETPWDSRQKINRLEANVNDAVHLIIRLQPDMFDDILTYFKDCQNEPGSLSLAANRLMSTGTRGGNLGTVYNILNKERIRRAPAASKTYEINENVNDSSVSKTIARNLKSIID
jgi:hypothetical protein